MKGEKGQALIELALAIGLLLIILFGITEFGRYFFQRNTLNNAARAGVRQAVVTPLLEVVPIEVCPGSSVLVADICETIPGADGSVSVKVELFDSDGFPTDPATTGDRVRVEVSRTFTILTGTIIPFFSGTRPIIGEASMRYE